MDSVMSVLQEAFPTLVCYVPPALPFSYSVLFTRGVPCIHVSVWQQQYGRSVLSDLLVYVLAFH